VARDRLRAFDSRSGFGSADYYGRDESIRSSTSSSSRSSGVPVDALLTEASYQAREFATKLVGQAKDDWEGVKRVVGMGAGKVGEYLNDVAVSLNCILFFIFYFCFFLKRMGFSSIINHSSPFFF